MVVDFLEDGFSIETNHSRERTKRKRLALERLNSGMDGSIHMAHLNSLWPN